jgi:hypothetical protein
MTVQHPGPFTRPSLAASSATPSARLMHRRHALNLPPGTERTRPLQHHSCTYACSTSLARCMRSTVQAARELTDLGLQLCTGWSHWWPCSCWSLRTPSSPRELQVAERLPRYARRSYAQPNTPAASLTPSHDSSQPSPTSAVSCALAGDDRMETIRHSVHAPLPGSLTFEDVSTVFRLPS